MDRVDAVNAVLERAVEGGAYLEIGVQQGHAFQQVRARVRIGVDPKFGSPALWWRARLGPVRARLGLRSGQFLFACTSDRFFRTQRGLLGRTPLDCVLVDGLHTGDQAFRDIVNSLEHLGERGVIVVHDCSPRSEWAAFPTLGMAFRHPEFTGEWNGDVWRAMVRLRATRSDLKVCVLDCDFGLGLVRRGEPEVPLALSEPELDALTYEDLDADRVTLLNLRPADHLAEFLA
jgi:Methyltransferase domain